jgi:hypothetical protein
MRYYIYLTDPEDTDKSFVFGDSGAPIYNKLNGQDTLHSFLIGKFGYRRLLSPCNLVIQQTKQFIMKQSKRNTSVRVLNLLLFFITYFFLQHPQQAKEKDFEAYRKHGLKNIYFRVLFNIIYYFYSPSA